MNADTTDQAIARNAKIAKDRRNWKAKTFETRRNRGSGGVGKDGVTARQQEIGKADFRQFP
jgi:hypothetical protein